MDRQPAVLYVEDDPQSRKIMQMLLTGRMRLPHVHIFDDSVDFQARVEQLSPRPDIIFLDIHVKPFNGFEMLEMLRQQEAFNHIPIVALTASVMNEEVYKLQTAGFDSCLAKPLDMVTFPEIFNRILAGETLWRILE
jgi:CheY-like chemotaxis protein